MDKPPVANRPEPPVQRGRYNNSHPDHKKYTQGAWPRLARKIKSDNPICQRLPATGMYRPGEQCHSPAVLVHHRRGALAHPELFLSVYDNEGVSNLIALCQRCHVDSDGTDGENGTDNWIEGIHFVRTQYKQWGVG